VVDVHHKPRGLTSLPRCHLYQVHKVQHKPRKKFSWGLKQIWSKGHVSVLPMAHRTVSGAPVRATLEQLILGFLWGALCYNSLDCPVCIGHVRRANEATVTWRHWSTANRDNASQKSEQKVRTHSYMTKGFKGQPLQTPNERAEVARTGQ
jgi:hypothetical protein